MYYTRPTQIKFFESGIHAPIGWYGGVAVADRVICGHCGNVFSIAELISLAPKQVEHPIQTFSSWFDISDDIIEKNIETPYIKILTDEI